jgi:dUTP pyrophosphatase
MPQSGMLMDKISMVPGVIDRDYTGVISVIVSNDSINTYTLMPGQAMAQIIFAPAPEVAIEEVEQVAPTKWGTKGFSSTDVQTYATSVRTLNKHQQRPPRTHYLGA